jgi:acyl-CoA thioester hydrolase
MGHQNVRFYVSRAMEGVRELLERHGLSTQQKPSQLAAWPVVHHLRLLRENRAGTPLHLRGGLVAVGRATITAALTLFHSENSEVSATFIIELEARKYPMEGAAEWPAEFVVPAALHALPDLCQPRGLADTPTFPIGIAKADELGMIEVGSGIISDDTCDRMGRLRPESFIAFLSNSTRTLTNAFHREAEMLPDAPERIGSAGVECRLRYYRFPYAGDRYVVRGGLSDLSDRRRKTLYWMLDRATGAPLAELEAVELLLDLDSRRSFKLGLSALNRLKRHVIPLCDC